MFGKRREPEPYVIENGGRYGFEVVGESFRRPHLAAIASTFDADARAAGRGHSLAGLVREPGNAQDPNAVAVHMMRDVVGYVSRDRAPYVARYVDAQNAAGRNVVMRAVVVWHPEIAASDYGVWLDMPPEPDRLVACPMSPLTSSTPVVAVRAAASTPPAVSLPPAGWHVDPDDAAQWRYWDGSAWTDHRAPRA